MKSSATSSFWAAFASLPPEIQAQARKAYRLWQQNHRHPSLHFEPKGDYWSVRITRGWRALGRLHEGTLYWFWIGSHEEYERRPFAAIFRLIFGRHGGFGDLRCAVRWVRRRGVVPAFSGQVKPGFK